MRHSQCVAYQRYLVMKLALCEDYTIGQGASMASACCTGEMLERFENPREGTCLRHPSRLYLGCPHWDCCLSEDATVCLHGDARVTYFLFSLVADGLHRDCCDGTVVQAAVAVPIVFGRNVEHASENWRCNRMCVVCVLQKLLTSCGLMHLRERQYERSVLPFGPDGHPVRAFATMVLKKRHRVNCVRVNGAPFFFKLVSLAKSACLISVRTIVENKLCT